MIHLDTNVLIGLSIPGSTAAAKVRAWLLAGETPATSAPAWFEYISGPVSLQEITRAEAILRGGIVEFDKTHAGCAADLFNKCGRKRSIKLDCMIAAAALKTSSRLATGNPADFAAFGSEGLVVESV